MDEIGENKFSAKLLVEGLMESSFGSSPQEWSEIVKMENALEKYELIISEGEGRYSAPGLTALRKAFEECRTRVEPCKDMAIHLQQQKEKLNALKDEIARYLVPEDFPVLKEHIDTIQKIADVFATEFNAIEVAVAAGEYDRIPAALDRMESIVSAGSSGEHDEEGRPRSQLTTVFRVTQGVKTVEKNFSSPCYDMIQNALRDYRDGTIDETTFIGTVQKSLEQIVLFHQFLTEELEWMNENDSELYSKYRDAVASISRSQCFCREGTERILNYFNEHHEEELQQGMETFFRGIQELACIYVLLDHLKRSGY